VGNYKGSVVNGQRGLRPAPVRIRADGGARSARVCASHFPLSIGICCLFSVFQALESHCGITVPQFSAVNSGQISEHFVEISAMRTHNRLSENVLIQPGTIDKRTKWRVARFPTLAASSLFVSYYIHISFCLIRR